MISKVVSLFFCDTTYFFNLNKIKVYLLSPVKSNF